MALVLSLVKGYDLKSDVSSLSLVSGTDGIRLLKWDQGIYNSGDLRVVDTMELEFSGSTYDDLAAKLQAFDDYVRAATNFHTVPVEPYAIYLKAQGYSETGARRSLVYSIRRDPIRPFHAPAMPGNIIDRYNISIERGIYWEDITGEEFATALDPMTVTTIGDTVEYTSLGGSYPTTVAGDVEARVALAAAYGEPGSGTLTRFWLGFRSDRYGDHDKFEPVWNLNLGTAGTDTTKNVVDATSSSGERVRTTFATTATMAARLTITVGQAEPTDYAEQRGVFLVLLRARLSAAGEVRVRLADGLVSNASLRTQARQVIVNSSGYAFYELGTVNIPSPGRWPSLSSPIKSMALQVQAERVSGSAELYMDCFVMIPYNEGFVFTDSAVIVDSAGPRGIGVLEGPDGSRHSLQTDTSGELSNVGVPQITGGLPPGQGVLVVAADRGPSLAGALADSMNLYLTVYQRWTTLRGAD